MRTSLLQCYLTEAGFSGPKQLTGKGKEKIMGSNMRKHVVYTKHAARCNKYGINSPYNLRNVAG